ncbi:TetR/AcrR family transcriptional regulator [Nocardioides sp. cx-173]|uniref:TetR/AcrR family transcriptional regulator n=1 Tax=Nocardioides sp. cx-173 TaxID=2898796 RepID=UPI001E4DABC6|nr:TetR-like C-terminal domain-containing protein [Nocardioides sp. cx-173]MCD4526571.1 WHG domain-containing protein [Nocardioides sp. cx-173]UGB40666.1 WHG domain-containing protein [Nocardioides sp. cx-173]
MPAPERTSLEQIVTAGRELLESEGPARLTMQAVAARVGVRAPSLYKRVRDRDSLLALVAGATIEDLVGRLDEAEASVAGLARTFRSFAHERPEGFRLMMAASTDGEALARASAPVLRIAEELVGSDDALEAARLVTAWATGFITMELAGAFRLHGDLERAFEFGLERISSTLSRRP